MIIHNIQTHGVCSKSIMVAVNNEYQIINVKFSGGCSGGLSAVSKLLIGMPVNKAVEILCSVECGNKGTSCPAQLGEFLKTAYQRHLEG